jgi:hypothetical protein
MRSAEGSGAVGETEVGKTEVDKTEVDKTKMDKTEVDKTEVDKTEMGMYMDMGMGHGRQSGATWQAVGGLVRLTSLDMDRNRLVCLPDEVRQSGCAAAALLLPAAAACCCLLRCCCLLLTRLPPQ